MKKYFIIAAIAITALASCTKDEPAQQDEQNAISFTTPVVRQNTKAALEVGEIYPTNKTFAVWGHYYSGEYDKFDNGKIYINEAIASYDNNNSANTWYPKTSEGNYYYWPKNGTLTFIAYSPATTANAVRSEVTSNGLVIADYTVSTKPEEQEDLLFSERAYDMTHSSQGTLTGDKSPYNGVDLEFKHALSSVVFRAILNGAYTGTTVKLKGIKLSNVISKGTFSQNLDDEPDKITKTPIKNTGDNVSTNEAAWTYATTPERSEYVVDLTAATLSNTDYYWPCTSSTTEPSYYTTTVNNDTRKTDLMLIPQEHNTTDDAKKITLTINYSIQSPNSVEIDQVYTTTLNNTNGWQMGYRYIYTITIGFDPITLAPTVSVFVDATGIEVKPDYQ